MARAESGEGTVSDPTGMTTLEIVAALVEKVRERARVHYRYAVDQTGRFRGDEASAIAELIEREAAALLSKRTPTREDSAP